MSYWWQQSQYQEAQNFAYKNQAKIHIWSLDRNLKFIKKKKWNDFIQYIVLTCFLCKKTQLIPTLQRRQTPSLPTVNPETTVWYRGHGNPITTLSLAFNQSCAIWIDFHRVPWGLPNDHFTPDDSLTMSQELSSITNKPTLLFRSGHNYQFTAPSLYELA